MPDQVLRDRYIWGELAAMTSACIAMLWYMLLLLPWMMSICATDPLRGAIAHLPWIFMAACVLLAKTRYLWRLLVQVKGLT